MRNTVFLHFRQRISMNTSCKSGDNNIHLREAIISDNELFYDFLVVFDRLLNYTYNCPMRQCLYVCIWEWKLSVLILCRKSLAVLVVHLCCCISSMVNWPLVTDSNFFCTCDGKTLNIASMYAIVRYRYFNNFYTVFRYLRFFRPVLRYPIPSHAPPPCCFTNASRF